MQQNNETTSPTPMQELSKKIRERDRVYVPRETREFNSACESLFETLGVLMRVHHDKSHPLPRREFARHIFMELFEFNDYFVNHRLVGDAIEKEKAKQPELFNQKNEENDFQQTERQY